MPKVKKLVQSDSIISETIKDLIAGGINNETLKEKVQEYVEAKKLVKRIAKEIMKEINQSQKTSDYINDLEADLKDINEKMEERLLLADIYSEGE